MDVNESSPPIKAIECIRGICQLNSFVIMIAEDFSHGVDCNLTPTFLSCT